ASPRSTAKPMSESIDHSWICREDSASRKRIGASKEIRVTHNSVFAAHRLQCRMTNRKNRHPAFCLEIESGSEKRRKKKASYSPSWCQTYTLFLDLRNVPGGKLPATIALDQRVRELHDSIECFAVRCSFHARFPENNRYAIIVKSR